jgi:hypothetical protein
MTLPSSSEDGMFPAVEGPDSSRYRRSKKRSLVSSNPHQTDHRLEPFAPALKHRYQAYQKALSAIEEHEGGLAHFSEGYKNMGFQVDSQGGVTYREWAPSPVSARLIGDFSKSVSMTS